MKKIFFFFLAFFAVNSIFSQNLLAEEILKDMPEIDRIVLDKYYKGRLLCPPCPECPQIKKPVKKFPTTSAPKPAPMPGAPIVNIIGDNKYDKIEIINDRNGFRLNLEKAKPICCPEKIIWVPLVKGDSVILFPGADPVPLPHVLPNPNGNYFNSVPDLGNPSGGSSKNFPGMSEKFGYPLFLAFLLGLLMMLWGTYLLSRLRSTGTSSVTSITSETSAPLSKPAPPATPVDSAKTETPVSENKTEETSEFKSRNRDGYRKKDTGETQKES